MDNLRHRTKIFVNEKHTILCFGKLRDVVVKDVPAWKDSRYGILYDRSSDDAIHLAMIDQFRFAFNSEGKIVRGMGLIKPSARNF